MDSLGSLDNAEPRSQLGLDEHHSVLEKLGLFLTALFLGPLIGLLLFAGISQLIEPWRSLGEIFGEAFAIFWVCSLVFIWWRPLWFRKFYLWAERKLIFMVDLLGFASLFLSIIALAVIGIIALFRHFLG